MKRKLIRQGKNALTITLPAKWIDKKGLAAGDEVEISENNDIIQISSSDNSNKKTTVVFNSENYEKVLRIGLLSLYKLGIDEVQVLSQNPKMLNIIQQQIDKQLLGYEIISQSHNSCVIKAITEIKEENFDDLIKRLFSIIYNFSESIYDGLKEKDSEILENAYHLDRTVNKTANYISRLILKTGLKNNQNSYYYMVSRQLEDLADHYRDFGLHFSKNTINISNEELAMLFDANKIFEDIRLCYFAFSYKKYETLSNDLKSLRERINQFLNNNKGDFNYLGILQLIIESMKPIVITLLDIKLTESLEVRED